MTAPAISIRDLAKQYRLGGAGTAYTTLRDSVAGVVRRRRKPSSDWMWALDGVTADIAAGDVVGIIGRNGAGKSTLLKILSRVTDPTRGEVILHGRVGSLLEVGTGFHPELTGRENILLSAAILGLRRAQLARRFDEIVAFSELERFLDTPVKHYSSGMYVRLAFSVAAHLDPDILLVDEVLSVGDAAFQKKCVAKMLDTTAGERTILFVSHNLALVNALCGRGIVLGAGRVVFDGPVKDAVARYLESEESRAGVALEDRTDRTGSGTIRMTSVRVTSHEDEPLDIVMSGQPVRFVIGYKGRAALDNVFFQIQVSTSFGQNLFVCLTRSAGGNFERLDPEGEVACDVPMLPLLPGTYRIGVTAKVRDVLADELEAMHLTVVEGDVFGTGRLPPASSGPIVVPHQWRAGRGVATLDWVNR